MSSPYPPLFSCDGSLLFTTSNYKPKITEINTSDLKDTTFGSDSGSKVLFYDTEGDYTLLLIDTSIPAQQLISYRLNIRLNGELLAFRNLTELPVYLSMNRHVIAIFYPKRIELYSFSLHQRAIFNSMLFDFLFSQFILFS